MNFKGALSFFWSCLLSSSVGFAIESPNPVFELTHQNDTFLNNSIYTKVHSYFKKSKVFMNFTLEDTIEAVDAINNWKAPENFVNNLPYYLSGYDYENRPIWVGEVGKYDINGLVANKGPEALENLEKFILQGCLRVLNSVIEKDTAENEVRQAVGLLDCEGLKVLQLTDLPTIAFLVRRIPIYFDFGSQAVGKAIFINVNYAAEVFLDIFRPLLGGITENFEVYGNNKAKWMRELRRLLPEESIPSWYGGRKDFKPLKLYG